MRLRALIAGVALPLVLWAVLPLVSQGASPGQVGARIDSTRGKIDRNRARDRVLSQDVARYSTRIHGLQGTITDLQARQVDIQRDLDAKRAELARIQTDLREQRARLERLRARLARAQRVLAARLVELYKTDDPDLITVVLEADGFAELVERAEFIGRINRQDGRIIELVRSARRESIATTKRLAKLERRQQQVTAIILARRNQVANNKATLQSRRDDFAEARDSRTSVLSDVRSKRRGLMENLASLEKEQAKIQARLSGIPAGSIKQGKGGMIWPLNGTISGSFGENRGDHMHAGIDIVVPNGTPVRAAKSGKVVLAAPTGGYGNYMCVGHGGGLSTCYAHLSSFSASGNVSTGQVIAQSGNTGHSTGPHLHFEVRVNGSPVNPLGYL
jgi:murein DD-endopeptidase MepM/ murein hydrolase activator NlpD